MRQLSAKPGPSNSLLDVGGVRVGQAGDAVINTGTTLIVPDAPVAMAADVRGGGPGTRETEALNPDCLVDRVHGLVLSGGSVFGLKAADRLVERLSADGVGLDIGARCVPVVPSAILFDLANGGDKNWVESPYGRLTDEAYAALGAPIEEGRAGAGFGARAGDQKGGIGTASFAAPDGMVVGALVAVNCFGLATDVAGGAAPLHGQVHLPKVGLMGANTTIAAVATNLDLDKAGCRRLAIMAQDGLARAIRPLHTPFDGDTVFAFSVHEKPVAREALPLRLAEAGTLAADALAVAVGRALAAANPK